MKDFLSKIVSEKQEKRDSLNSRLTEIRELVEKSEDAEEVKKLGEEFNQVEADLEIAEAELKEAQEKLDELEVVEEQSAEEPIAEPENEEPVAEEPVAEPEEERAEDWVTVEERDLTKVSSMEIRGGENMDKNLEYRKSFMEAVQTRNYAKLEKRADAYTFSTDVEYVIPENLVNDIITEISNRGYIYNLVNKTNFAVGQTIPVGMVAIEATWVGDANGSTQAEKSGEGLGSDVQKGGVQATIVFHNYKLRCVVGITHEAKIQSLEVFERKFIEQVAEAMLEKIEDAIVNGDGVNKPKGILKETANNSVEVEAAKDMDYKTLIQFVGKIPARYRKGAVIFMTQNTFYKCLAITDQAGQPVARVNAGVDGELKQYLFTTPVIFADEYLKDYEDTVAEDTIFGFAYNFKEYTLNTNYDLGISSRQVWENENHETKAVLACDGKAVTKYSLVTYVKKSASV